MANEESASPTTRRGSEVQRELPGKRQRRALRAGDGLEVVEAAVLKAQRDARAPQAALQSISRASRWACSWRSFSRCSCPSTQAGQWVQTRPARQRDRYGPWVSHIASRVGSAAAA